MTAACSGTDDGADDPSPEPAEEALVLLPFGINGTEFGDPRDDTLEAITDVLGPPDPDTDPPTTIDSGTFTGAEWDDNALIVLFSDGKIYRDDGVEHFVGWRYEGPVNGTEGATESGVTVGSTAEEVVQAYPAATVQVDACLDKWAFTLGEAYETVDVPQESLPLKAVLTADPDDPASTVEWLIAGFWLC